MDRSRLTTLFHHTHDRLSSVTPASLLTALQLYLPPNAAALLPDDFAAQVAAFLEAEAKGASKDAVLVR